MNYIIFGFEHYNPLGLARTLGENGIKPVGIIIRNKRKITSKSKYFKQIYFVDCIDDGYDLLIKNFGIHSKDIIFTSDDQITGLLDSRYDLLKDRFYFNNAGVSNRINQFMDKWNICQLAKEVGISIAETVQVTKSDFLSSKIDFSKFKFPVITKAINSKIDNWKDDSYICNNENELREAFNNIRSEAVLVQHYIEKKNELCIEGCAWNSGNAVLISIASTYNYILPDTYSPFMTVSSLEDSELEEKIKRMLLLIGYEGIFEIEFLIGNDDQLYFLEINFRNSTWSYASTVAGMPLPIIWTNGMTNSSIKSSKIKIDRPFTAMVEFGDFGYRVIRGNPYRISILKWLEEFKNAKCKYYWNAKDQAPFWSMSKYKAIYFMKIVIHRLKG